MKNTPVILDPILAHDAATLEALRNDRDVTVCDTLAEQLTDLAQTRSPSVRLDAAALASGVRKILGDRDERSFGRWVYFPWRRTLVHILPPDAFAELRSDRNRNKITSDEQARLATRTVAIAGLSVGLAIATTLALEGVGGTLHLADFDTLGLSNLNRLLGSVAELGLPKVDIAARRLYELNPYLTIRAFPEGVREDNIEVFLAGVDLLCEECDSFPMKLRLREVARRQRIPVLMETSDRGMLDIERFDLDPERPLLHGLLGGVEPGQVANLAAPERMALVQRIVGACSERMTQSLPEIGRTLSTWPQLGSSVTLGGGSACDAARRILLGQHTASGRWWVDVAAIIAS
jgi:molybdopterin/thiamine biosynthesis adenylyltransferase